MGKFNDVVTFCLAVLSVALVLLAFDRIANPTLNTDIGITFVAMAVLAILWAARSWYFWWETSPTRRPELTSYRMAISVFLTVFLVFMLDAIRLRFKLDVGMNRSPTNPVTFWVRVSLAVSMLWGTGLLYRVNLARLRRFISRRRPPGGGGGGTGDVETVPLRDPYLDSPDETVKKIRRREQSTEGIINTLRRFSTELDRIADNIENDPEQIAPVGKRPSVTPLHTRRRA